jgi:hypothetical protein
MGDGRESSVLSRVSTTEREVEWEFATLHDQRMVEGRSSIRLWIPNGMNAR